ncbi:MAG: 30S ribosomal protein S2 [Candidatus Berkelbacteria bacterium]|nr:30S ribosomal protein S2 [Candidatus Berkelbacteria bacterium]
MSVTIPTVKELFKAGAHFGHRKARTDARSQEYIFTYRNKVAVIDLEKTRAGLEKALDFLVNQAKQGATILFVGTKDQAKDKVKETAEALKQPYIVSRWPGGLLTNYNEVAKSVKKMLKIESNIAENKYENLTKKERLLIERDLRKKQTIFGGLRYLERKPDALIAIDAKEEEIAIREARASGIATVAICDTNSNPKIIDYCIPANDDSQQAIEIIFGLIKDTIEKNFKPKASAEENLEGRVDRAISKKEDVKKETIPAAKRAVARKVTMKKAVTAKK